MRKLSDKKLLAVMLLVSVVVFGSLAYSHCQIPCGIYDDEARFSTIAEHITTIEKSIKQIEALSAEKKVDMNQVVRWVNNKDQHADELSEIVTYYFMAQRIKLPAAGDTKAYNAYVGKLTLLHEMLVYAMKAKQTTDLANIDKLRAALEKFHAAYSADAG
ncbi:MAG: superoxide dismutase [Ni] [Planctomycetota bacterium]